MRHPLLRAREIPVLEALAPGLVELEAALRMPERGLGAAEGRVDARALPLAAGDVRGRADPAPHVAGHVGRVDHLVGLLGRALGKLEELPHAVEGRDRELPLPGGVH